jgi:hypothetical protein
MASVPQAPGRDARSGAPARSLRGHLPVLGSTTAIIGRVDHSLYRVFRRSKRTVRGGSVCEVGRGRVGKGRNVGASSIPNALRLRDGDQFFLR